MKRLLVTLILFVILSNSNVFSQVSPDYTQKLYYLCKVWGYMKYFHTEVAKGNLNWDSLLVVALSEVESATTQAEFNTVLFNFMNKAGTMAVPTTPPPDIEDSLKYNLDLSWFDDTILSNEVKTQLDTIKSRFRKQDNFYIVSPGPGNPYLFTDTVFYRIGFNVSKNIRLNGLFRYWNIINYFYPYKHIMDQNWDSTLVEFIKKIANTSNDYEYQQAILELATHLNDSHAFTNSAIIDAMDGNMYPPFNIAFIQNETAITKVIEGNDNFRTGDIIREIDGVNIRTLRDSLHKITIGSNEPTINRNINSSILIGEDTYTSMKVENTDGTRNINFRRNLTYSEFESLITPKGPIWKIIEGTNVGYVDMGRILPDSVPSMFRDLWNTQGIVFDIRNYPQGSIYNIVEYLSPAPIQFVKFTIPYIQYPGSFTWMDFSIGGENPQPELYDGKITLLFNEETQSHAEFTCMAFDFFDQTYKIGSQTAGADGNVSSMYLPGGITTYFTGLGVYYPDGRETQRVGIIPDLEMHPTINGIREGRDELLDEAVRRIVGVNENVLTTKGLKLSPNPVNDEASISYFLDKYSEVRLILCNSFGSEISVLVNNEFQIEGLHQVTLNTKNINSGMYYLILKKGTALEMVKAIVVR